MTHALHGVPLVVVRRGEWIESVHHVAACACTSDGTVKLGVGDIETPVFVRSALKPMIAATVAVAASEADISLSSEELAIIAASHQGEEMHVHTVRRLLARAGASEEALQCGPARSRQSGATREVRAIFNNCSGKHAGLLLLCALRGYDSADYLAADHPANQAWMDLAGRLYGVDVTRGPQGIDGCGLPVFAVSLHAQAQGYARFASSREVARADLAGIDAVREAMLRHPELVGGSRHLDTRLMSAEPGTLLAKIGAEGVHCSAAPTQNLGLALKVLDGHERARPPSVIGLLSHLGMLSLRAGEALEDLSRTPILNVAGDTVGDIRFFAEGLS